MPYNFDELITRRGTGCVKWDEQSADDIIPMWVADMDFRCARPIINALRRRVEHGVYGYTHVPEQYYQAVIDWFRRRHGWTIQREWMLYTTGVVPALSVIVKALCEPGDKVIVQTPAYNCFFSSVKNNGCLVEENPLVYENHTYHIDFDALERSCSDPRAKLLLFCNPHNPGGRVWTREEMLSLNDICMRHGVRVLADEIHNELVMPGYEYLPFASLSDETLANSISCNAPSKSFNTAGMYISNIECSDAAIRQKLDRVININEVCDVNLFGVEAVMAAYNESEDWIDQLCPYIWDNYQALCAFFKEEMPSIGITKLEGTYLVWADISALGITSEALCQRLLDEGRVWMNPGTMYDPREGKHFIRINIAAPRSRVMEGLRRMAKVVKQITADGNE